MSLVEVMKEEKESLEGLYDALREQYLYIMKNDIFKLNEIIETIQECSKSVAKAEISRRKELNGKPLKEVTNVDSEVKVMYEQIKEVLERVQMQKETNELLIKQQLVLTNKLLAVINPVREQKTYNSYGKIKR